MYQVKGTLVGTSDLLFNVMTKRAMDALDTGNSGGKLTLEQRMAEAYEAFYKDEDGNAIVHPWTFKVVAANGAKKGNIKEGKSSFASFLMASVFVAETIRLEPGQPDYIHVCVGRRPPRTGGACVIRRPAWKTGWRASFVLNVLDDRRNADNIKNSILEAGLTTAMGSYRPEYGRFTLEDWEVLKNGKRQ